MLVTKITKLGQASRVPITIEKWLCLTLFVLTFEGNKGASLMSSEYIGDWVTKRSDFSPLKTNDSAQLRTIINYSYHNCTVTWSSKVK